MTLEVVEREMVVNGKTASCYCLEPFGLRFKQGEAFDVTVVNHLDVPTSIHWHGLILPNHEDGVAGVTQFPLYPESQTRYLFPLKQTGTYWMHAHYDLQEQLQLSAPLIIEDDLGYPETTLFLTDFSFRSPEEIYSALKCSKESIEHRGDLIDVHYDAFLANGRTLEAPEIVEVEPGTQFRIRAINGSAATNFTVALGALRGEAIAIDGNRIEPFAAPSFELAVAQRVDIVVTIPEEGGAFPLLALVEGRKMQTGIVLATKGATIPTLTSTTQVEGKKLVNRDEGSFHPLTPLPQKPTDKHLLVELGGQMSPYNWTINGQTWPNSTPLLVKEGERVEVTFRNATMMSHPMHLHGHLFQVTEINEMPVNGPLRDTVLVLPQSTLKIAFDALHPGVWPFHCHILFHQEAGMMTVLRYDNFVQPL